MDCKKCGTLLPDGGIFCPSCGARCDGKITCKNCSSLIDENATYCTYCGVRVDGKTACAKCGAIFEGSFCPSCGADNSSLSKVKKRKEKADNSAGTRFGAVERILSPCLSLGAILVLFVLSFFIGVSVDVFGSNANQYVKEFGAVDMTIFYYFGDSFKNTDAVLEAYSTNINRATTAGVLNAFDATMLVIGILYLLTISFIFIYSCIKVGVSLYRGEQVNIGGMLGGAIGSFLTMSAVLVASGAIKVSVNTVTAMKVGFNGAAISGLVVSLVLAVAVAVLSLLAKGRTAFRLQSILSKSLTLVGVAFTVVALLLCGKEIINVKQGELGVSVGLAALPFTDVIAMEVLNVKNPSHYVPSLNLSLIETYLTIAIVVALGVVCWSLVRSLLGGGKSLALIVPMIISAVIGVAWLVVALLFKKEYLSVSFLSDTENALNAGTTMSLSGSVIVVLVFTVIVLGLSIANMVLEKTDKR